MISSTAVTVFGLVLASLGVQASTPLVRTYQGDSFFDRWTYYGHYDNTTNGDAIFANKSVATSTPELTYVTSDGSAIIRVDNSSTVQYNYKRDTVKITSTDSYPVGSIWVLDAVHLPYGCSVWPAFWSYGAGATWPEDGEIDVIEGVNMGFSNQMALHTEDGCSLGSSGSSFSGIVNDTSCYYEANDNSGCGVTETNDASYGAAFAAAGGGVFVTQLAESGISIWFFSRPDIPDAISNADNEIDTSTLGTPSAYWGTDTCDITKFFGDQSLVFDITLCGDWAGKSNILSSTGCSALSGSDTCYTTYVLNASNYDTAYFEINSLKVYSNGSSSGSSSDSSSSSAPSTHGFSALGWLLAGVIGVSALAGMM
ncbi:endo-1,3(4)-beta-glucanase [Cryptococcus neoformans C23]|uniref:Endo-1,3(4)-beta-glucanase n=1 Tax=Cryptococcus neoformans (strain H99 / ATCC 208821 / CBS 10515 / FGSC 9487) TaxID=235443 RepID=J9VXD2_CRYN9|nr:endo-1,3(4)-beta-glucanase [Cryptococcus neoformans var. grubii H99]AUB29100.1 endo-1,3(4)-beta-glucanase [Cryptococcus neoformans var. grubii]OWZ26240.1 endo-1,3(4)-beta-glucanase [Cryptococcus neoformans var. grubii AD2-60a]OWZ38099.1 endo-1,3(4)-beta-glucanase [Cryptococcus neoformans var. grubii C23]OWZ53891.1 endo-1,3(4)-beta-glucanase [Cryptococcus neoformans var. grubii 125.91]OXC80967.1 endo-1,3(4)-beta-glucanase [Cryptococcus neoformans var. grubii AD1-7a]OXG53314.1 endo-1,3(4)-be|eukprot:XP_012053613.1 endo-1,3(4)-beta-glucanase [Cryptococcus neoformans var. grubii H99]